MLFSIGISHELVEGVHVVTSLDNVSGISRHVGGQCYMHLMNYDCVVDQLINCTTLSAGKHSVR